MVSTDHTLRPSTPRPPTNTSPAGNILSSCFGGLIAAGIIGRCRCFEAWRWLFIIEGSITVAVDLFAVFLFPDYPRNTRWLKPEEQLFGEWRLANEVAGVVDEDSEGVW
jgi:MFS family permease